MIDARKDYRGVAIDAVVLAHRSPLTLAEVGPPFLPGPSPLAALLQPQLFQIASRQISIPLSTRCGLEIPSQSQVQIDPLDMPLRLYVQQVHADHVVGQLLLLYVSEIDGPDLVACLRQPQGVFRIGRRRPETEPSHAPCRAESVASAVSTSSNAWSPGFARRPATAWLLLGGRSRHFSLQRAAGEQRCQYFPADTPDRIAAVLQYKQVARRWLSHARR